MVFLLNGWAPVFNMLTAVHSEKTEAQLRLWVNYNLILRAAGWNFSE